VRVGAQRPTHLLTPDGDFDFTDGDVAVELAASLGLHLLDWQRWLVRWILAVDADGTPACNTVILVVPRQNGKGAILEALELFWLIVAGVPTVIHTAHEADTAAGHMERIESLTADADIELPKLHTYKANGKERTRNLDDKLVLQYRTRTKATKRGASPQRIVLDEAQELQDAHLAALVPAMAAQSMSRDKLPQLIYTGSAPLEHSEYMHRLLDKVQRTRPAKTLLAMWACEADADPEDVENWYRSNPSLGILISEGWVRDTEFLVMAPADFAAERMGIAKQVESRSGVGPVDLEAWDALTDATSAPLPEGVRWALDVAHDRSWSTFGLAGRRVDGLTHVEITTAQPGTAWVVARAKEIQGKLGGLALTVGASSPAESLIAELVAAGVVVDVMKPGDQALAFVAFVDATRGDAPKIRHRGEPALRRAVKGARTKPWSDGGETLTRRGSMGDISPFSAAVMAFGRLGIVEAPKTAAAHVVFA